MDAAVVCGDHDECSDGVFCNGAEQCDPSAEGADAMGCVAATAERCMPTQTCDEEEARCLTMCDVEGDADGDGRRAIDCGGDDCEDADPNRFPGNAEVCDVDDHDEDCDPSTFGFRDVDGDGAPDAACCNEDLGGERRCGADCNDASTTTHPSAPESCDGTDNDCDEGIDEGVTETFWPDGDGDGFGSSDPAVTPTEACFTPADHADNDRDCDDAAAAINPGNPELCDAAAVDEDCDGVANPDTLCTCTGGGSRPCALGGACASGIETCAGGRWGACSISPVAEVCNGLNDDCDGAVDEGVSITCYDDLDNDGYAAAEAAESERCGDAGRLDVGGCPAFTTNRLPLGTALDCDDAQATRRPAATEACNALDDDCDGAVDEGVSITCYADADGDTFPTAGAPGVSTCAVSGRAFVGGCPAGATNQAPGAAADCDDARSFVNPEGIEACNSLDDDCDGAVDDGVLTTYWVDGDGDGFGSSVAATQLACVRPAGYAEDAGDCDDATSAVNPGVGETCDATGVDEDCDGVANPASFCMCSGSEARPCTLGGACAAGVERCSDGSWGSCSITPIGEVCNEINDDCDGAIDEGLTVICYGDADNDGYPPAGSPESAHCPDSTRTLVGGCPANFTDRAPLVELDCDEGDASRNPGVVESCNGRDDDCDGTTDEGVSIGCYADSDGDSYAPATALLGQVCSVAGRDAVGGCPVGMTNRDPAALSDCDDGNSAVSPAGIETCNGRDDDCDGPVDDGVLTTFYVDSDGDGFGSSGTSVAACFRPDGYDAEATDCDDTSAAINPAVPELCDAATVDENCDGTANPAGLCMCSGSETRPCSLPGTCAAGAETCLSGAWSGCSIMPVSETCNELDDDCDGSRDEGLTVTCYADSDNDGYAGTEAAQSEECPDGSRVDVGGCPAGTTNRPPFGSSIDCNDSLSTTRPGASEICNGVNDDCDGATDEGVVVNCYEDVDGDTYAATSATSMGLCPAAGRALVGGCPLGTTNREPTTAADCDDVSSAVNPSASEVCDAGPIDDDCDGMPNDGCDCVDDSLRSCVEEVGRCASGTQTCVSGVWGGCSYLPAVEVCNLEDDDCDGTVDEAVTVTCYADPDDDGYAEGGAAAQTTCPASGRGAVGGCPVQLTNLAPDMTSTTDCAESNASAHPGGVEVCDGSMVDEDCNGTPNPSDLCACVNGATRGCPDPGRCSVGTQTCAGGAWGACSVSPATETCNEVDDDCDGTVDDGVTVTCYQDEDGDTYPVTGALPEEVCPDSSRPSVGGCPSGRTNIAPTSGTGDCDDSPDGAAIHPGATELCDADGVDENCAGGVNENPPCTCTNGASRSCPALGVCATGTQSCGSGSWGACSVSAAAESCNGSDDDCDGSVDEGVTTTCYEDGDEDGYAAASAATTFACGGCGTGLTDRAPSGSNIDCRPTDGASYPGATEICDRIDNDCSSGGGSNTAEDWDDDGHAPSGGACTGGFPEDDCQDRNDDVNPDQNGYFPAPYCPSGTYVCATCSGIPRCSASSGVACLCFSPITIVPSYDYDCSGSNERAPVRSSCSCSGGTFFCGGSGPTSSTADCGVSTTYRVCGGTTCGLGCTSSLESRPMACR